MKAGLSWLWILGDLVYFLYLGLRSRTSLAAAILFLRKQLACLQERKIKIKPWGCLSRASSCQSSAADGRWR